MSRPGTRRCLVNQAKNAWQILPSVVPKVISSKARLLKLLKLLISWQYK